MKTYRFTKIIYLLVVAAATTLAACIDHDASEPDPAEEQPEIVTPNLQFRVLEMEQVGGSRALEPMSEFEERFVKTLALFEFDNEGMHISGPNTYHFVDFIKGTIDGTPGPAGSLADEPNPDGVTEAVLTGLPFERHSNGMICAVANVTEEEVDSMYVQYKEEGQTTGRLLFSRFKMWRMPFTYKEGKYDYEEEVSGHLINMYMFGYWEGNIAGDDTPIPIDLGRLASRLDITIINLTGREVTRRFGYHFDNVCDSAYFFPMKMGVPAQSGAGQSRTIICSGYVPGSDNEVDVVEGADPNLKIPATFPNGASHTRFFYTAAHSAKNYIEATKLHLFWNSRIIEESSLTSPDGLQAWVPMCNLHPDVAPYVTNGYSLSRNTRYHFTMRLLPEPSGNHEEAPASRAVEVAPGVYNIYIPVSDLN